jgi:tRNA(Ile2) C34 agmatinyltransferase TiaS
MTDETGKAWQCPKDGTVMQPLGRRSRAWRCPTCKGIFMDTEAMRRGRPPKWSPVLTSVVRPKARRGRTLRKETRPGAMPGLVELSVR